MGEGEVPRQNLSDPYWRGRWCDRRGCDDGGLYTCGVWPLALYRMVLGAVWGDAPDTWLLVRVGEPGKVGGVVVGVEEAKLERFAGALGMVSQMYVELLGRFPDVGALLSRAPRLAALTLQRGVFTERVHMCLVCVIFLEHLDTCSHVFLERHFSRTS